MTYYRKGGHTTFDCRYHIVWITKYRREWLNEDLQELVADMLEEISVELHVNVLRIGMEKDHVHMYVSIPLSVGNIPEVIQKLKGRSSKQLGEVEEYKSYFRRYYWKPGVGKRAVGYFVCTVGEVNDKLIREYIESQGKELPQATKSPAL